MAPSRRSLIEAIGEQHPDVEDPMESIVEGRVLVDGRIITNPRSQVRRDALISVRRPAALRGEAKLRPALEAFAVPVAGRTALDAGAAAGGFVRVLLDRGAARVYAVDVGHGQLLGSLRQDPRVVTLERTNISELDAALVPEPIDLVTLDLSYLALAAAVPYLSRLRLADGATLVALVKPMFELRLPQPPEDEARLEQARELAVEGIAAAGWQVTGSMRSPVRGGRGAVEFWVCGRHDRSRPG
ncbi:MAG TPA: SAM-dependent methyltransferase [Candidatus Dormibacteraeota bacterium]|jgi:23S rRNA (cytidine1920-2'-O)/16S rRNA (cytidine1409-2'-O)-methyltransferase